jgi:hypothetical protein
VGDPIPPGQPEISELILSWLIAVCGVLFGSLGD